MLQYVDCVRTGFWVYCATTRANKSRLYGGGHGLSYPLFPSPFSFPLTRFPNPDLPADEGHSCLTSLFWFFLIPLFSLFFSLSVLETVGYKINWER